MKACFVSVIDLPVECSHVDWSKVNTTINSFKEEAILFTVEWPC